MRKKYTNLIWKFIFILVLLKLLCISIFTQGIKMISKYYAFQVKFWIYRLKAILFSSYFLRSFHFPFSQILLRPSKNVAGIEIDWHIFFLIVSLFRIRFYYIVSSSTAFDTWYHPITFCILFVFGYYVCKWRFEYIHTAEIEVEYI